MVMLITVPGGVVTVDVWGLLESFLQLKKRTEQSRSGKYRMVFMCSPLRMVKGVKVF